MFLSLPTIAVLKIIFDRTDNLKQWGVLLGDEIPKQSPLYLSILKIKDRKLKKNVKQ
jgi:hypothetical protein